MGIKSTRDITREEAIETIVDRVHYSTNDQIAAALEALVGDDRMANYRIVPAVRDFVSDERLRKRFEGTVQ